MFFFQICEVGWLTTNYECLYARVAFFWGGASGSNWVHRKKIL